MQSFNNGHGGGRARGGGSEAASEGFSHLHSPAAAAAKEALAAMSWGQADLVSHSRGHDSMGHAPPPLPRLNSQLDRPGELTGELGRGGPSRALERHQSDRSLARGGSVSRGLKRSGESLETPEAMVLRRLEEAGVPLTDENRARAAR